MTVTMPLLERSELKLIAPTETLAADIVRFGASGFAENFETLVDAAGSARHLRAFILALALQGRLSSRQASDGTARDALVATLNDRSWRVEERPSKPKLDPKIEALAGKTPVPTQWVECRLDDCAQLINGRAYAQPELLAAGTPVIRIQNLNGGTAWYYSDLVLPDRQYCEHGDLLFAWSASFGPYIWSGLKAIYHYHIWKVNLSPALDKRFLFFSLMHITDVVREQSHGLAMLHMTKGQMERWPLLLPPLAEQQRIVARVDQLMALIDDLEAKQTKKRDLSTRFTKASFAALTGARSQETFDTAWSRVVDNFPTVVDRVENVNELRRLVLALAVQGRLSRTDARDTPAVAALECARGNRGWRIEERAPKPKLDPKIEALAGVTPVPKSWVECRLNDIAQLINGRAYAQPELLQAGTPVIRIQNLNGGNEWYYSDLTLPDRQYCEAGDLLFAWSASFGPYIWAGPKSIYHYHIWKIRLSEAIDKRFFYFTLMHISDVVREQSHGLAMLHMTKGQMERWPILLPSLAEQKRIVVKVDQLMKLCDDLEAKLRRAENRASKLVEAVVQEMVA